MPEERRPRSPLLALLLVLVLTGTAVAAGSGIGVTGPDGTVYHPASGAVVHLTYNVEDLDHGALLVVGETTAPAGWSARVDPASALVQNGTSVPFTVTFTPSSRTASGPATVTFAAVNTTTGATYVVHRSVTLVPYGNTLLLGVYPNPLPGVLGGPYATFALNIGLWVVLAGAIAVVSGAVAKRFGSGPIGERMRKLVQVPVFVWFLLIGLRVSLEGLPPSQAVLLAHDGVHGIVLFFLLYVIYRVYRAVLQYYSHRIAGRTETEIDDLLVPLLEKFGGAVLLVVGGFFVVQSLFQVDLGVFLAAGGFASIIVGLAAQSTLSNFFSGIQILLGRPFREGDDIQLENGTVARVEHIGLRATWLYHYRQHEIIVIPNNDLATKPVVNLMYPDKRYRVSFDIGVAYGSDVPLVRKLLLQAANEHPEVITETAGFEPRVFFIDHADNALLFTMRLFVMEVRERFRIAGELRERVDELFRENGVAVPFPQRTVWFANPVPGGEPRDLPGGAGDPVGDPQG